MANQNKTQSSFSAGILSEELFNRLDFKKISSGLKQCENFVIRPAGGVSYRTGTEFITETKDKTKKVKLVPYTIKRGYGYCLELGDQYIRFYKDGQLIMNQGSPYEIVTSYLENELEKIKYISTDEGLFLVHNNHKPALLKRISDTNWTLTDLKFNPSVVQPTKISLLQQKYYSADQTAYPRVDYDSWKYAVSIVDKDGNESLPLESDLFTNDISLSLQNIEVCMDIPANNDTISKIFVYRINKGIYNFMQMFDYKDLKQHTVSTDTGNGSAGNWQEKPLVGNKTSGTGNHSITFTGFHIKDTGLALDASKTVKEKFEGFSVNDYPSSVAIWNQRLILGGTVSKPTTLWFSRIGCYEDFSTTALNSADESFSLTLNSNSADAINDLIPFDDLICFTDTKIWRVVGSSANNMSAYIESYAGTAGLSPYCSKKSILYIDSSKSSVYNFSYSNEEGGYTGSNQTILSRDIFEGYTFKDISYRDTPIPILYTVRNDGVLLCMTYEKEENIYAWHIFTTKGYYKNVCVIDQEIEDDVYVVIERDGISYIENFKQEISEGEGVNESWHLDCASRYLSSSYLYCWIKDGEYYYTDSEEPEEGDDIILNTNVVVGSVDEDFLNEYTRYSSGDMLAPTLSSVSGLNRFAGKKVTVLADGNFYENMQVDNSGVLTLEKEAANVLVGLSYTGIIETLPFETQLSDESYTIGLNRRMVSVLINYKKMRGLSYKASSGQFYEIKPYKSSNFGEIIPLETDKYNCSVADGYKKDSSIIIRQTYPFPTTIRNITLEIKYGNKN